MHITGATDGLLITQNGIKPIADPKTFQLIADDIIQSRIDKLSQDVKSLQLRTDSKSLSIKESRELEQKNAQLRAFAAIQNLYTDRGQTLDPTIGAAHPNGPRSPNSPTPLGAERPPANAPPTAPSGGGGSIKSPTVRYGNVCEICGKPAYGKCSIRQIYVCNEHRTFTQGGRTMVCPH